MKRGLAIGLLVFSFLLFNACLSPCFSGQELQSGEGQYLEGKVAQVDFVRSTVSIEFVQPNGDNDETTFLVTQHTQIVKGTLRLSITDLNKGADAIVKYHIDPGSFSRLKADSINIKP